MFYDVVEMKDLANVRYSERWIPTDKKTRVYCTDESQLDQQQQDRLNNRYKQTSKHSLFLHKYPYLQFPVYFLVPFFSACMLMFCIAGLTKPEIEMQAIILALGLVLGSTGLLTSAYAVFKPHIRNAFVDRFNNRLLNTEIPGINTETDLRFEILRKFDDNGTLNKVEQISKSSAEHPLWVLMQGSLSAYLSNTQLLAQEIEQAQRRIESEVSEIIEEYHRSDEDIVKYYKLDAGMSVRWYMVEIKLIQRRINLDLAGHKTYYSCRYSVINRALTELRRRLESHANSELLKEYKLSLATLEANAVSCLRTLRSYLQPIEQVHQLDQKSHTDLLTDNLRIAREITQTSY